VRNRLPLALAIAIALTLGATAPVQGQGMANLPDIGSSAGELISPAREAQYGAMYLRELRRHGYVLDDPLVDDWLQAMAFRLVAASERPGNDYTFFMLRSRQINAFATLGGYIGTNAGLVLTAESEDEVAAVLAHEIAHVTQRHIVRSVERAQKDTLPIMLGMLAAVIAAQSSGSSSSDNAAQAAIAGGMGLMQQRQINYTRANEHEADRLGIHTLARAGYDPGAMAVFFGRLQRSYRAVGYEGYIPDYLRTHPVTTTRISEARDRAARYQTTSGGSVCVMENDGRVVECVRSVAQGGSASIAHRNPLLPEHLSRSRLDPGAVGEPGLFDWARERLRVMSAESGAAAVAEYQRLIEGGAALSDAQRYGLGLARLRANQGKAAMAELMPLVDRHPANYWAALALAEAEFRAGRIDAARTRFDAIQASLPNSRAVALNYARVLGEIGTPEAGRRAQEVLRPLLPHAAEDYAFQQIFARASELAGDLVRAGEAHAEAAFLSGRAEDALNQLEALKRREDLDYIQRARIDARIAALTPIVLEMRRQGIGPGRG
jgi:predicted Zn-dependent protease